MNSYRFSPSCLDKFQAYLDAEEFFESDYNYTDDGGYKKSLEEIVEERKQALLDYINKVPKVTTMQAARGTAFNECVDMATTGLHKNESVEVKTTGALWYCVCDGYDFLFDGELVRAAAKTLYKATCQFHAQATLLTEKGEVILHGYPDYIMPAEVRDLKTTESYVFGKYEHYWQRYVYPYILQASGLMQRCDWFDFEVIQLKEYKDGITRGEVYHEAYTDTDLETCRNELIPICNGLIDFIEENLDKINNTTIRS